MSFDAQSVILTLLGVMATVVAGVLAYRKKLGAKEAKVAGANQEMIKTVIRRLVQSSEVLSLDMILDLRAVHARRVEVDETLLMNPSTILQEAKIAIFESDFLADTDRNVLVEKLVGTNPERIIEPTDAGLLPRLVLTKNEIGPIILASLAASFAFFLSVTILTYDEPIAFSVEQQRSAYKYAVLALLGLMISALVARFVAPLFIKGTKPKNRTEADR